MGRHYKGLDYSKVTVKLDAEASRIVGQYMQDCLKRDPDMKHGVVSDAIRDAITLMGKYMEMSDIMETSCANLLDIAKVFDKIPGENATIYAEAIREAAVLLWCFHYDKDGKDDDFIRILQAGDNG